MMPHAKYDLGILFKHEPGPGTHGVVLRTEHFTRSEIVVDENLSLILDQFATGASCGFFRYATLDPHGSISLGTSGNYRIESCAAGGWLLRSRSPELPQYWVPCAPRLRLLDEHHRILSDDPIDLRQIEFDPSEWMISFDSSEKGVHDFVIWRIPFGNADLIPGLAEIDPFEMQSYFIYGSHSTYCRPADVYSHLVFGWIYGNHRVWPHYWKICDELDAYALYLILVGLESATGKQLYTLLRRQVLYSVIARQSDDGGWYHGEWTQDMESHYRLQCGGIHLLLNALESEPNPTVRAALDKATAFLAKCVDHTGIGTWLLHDSLELSVDGMRQSPFRWVSSTALGKSMSNMLVLNTHIDAVIALHRYQTVTQTEKYRELIASARVATRAVMARRPAEALYRLIFRGIAMTLLPEDEARRLPLIKRALKRLTWQLLIPRLHQIKAHLPRLVMPNGYIDRALTLQGLAHGYQSVNLWDLVRYRRCLPEEPLEHDVSKALHFTQESSLRRYWREPKQRQQHALAFWAEAVYHQCMANPDQEFRAWLAAAMLDLEDLKLGQPPSILGANTEAVPSAFRIPCPTPVDARLRVANLSTEVHMEFVVVNPCTQPVLLSWQMPPSTNLLWYTSDGAALPTKHKPVIASRCWIHGISPRYKTELSSQV